MLKDFQVTITRMSATEVATEIEAAEKLKLPEATEEKAADADKPQA